MGPDDVASAREQRRLEHVGTVPLLVTFGREPGDDKVANVIVQKGTVALRHDKRRGAERLALGGEMLPETLAGHEVEAAELAEVADAVDVAVLEDGRAHER